MECISGRQPESFASEEVGSAGGGFACRAARTSGEMGRTPPLLFSVKRRVAACTLPSNMNLVKSRGDLFQKNSVTLVRDAFGEN